MANALLTFVESWTINQFKKAQNVEKLDIKCNEKTGKLFFQFGGKTGAATATEFKEPLVSLVVGEPSERNPDGKFFLLHESGGAPVVATL